MAETAPDSTAATAAAAPGNQPDIDIINVLCLEALADYSLNTDLLQNWQAEIGDVAGNSELLSNAIQLEVLLAFPLSSAAFERKQKDALARCLKMLDALDNDVYYDFKLIINLLVFHATTTFYTRKIQLHRMGFASVLLDNLLRDLDTVRGSMASEQRELIVQKTRILLSFMELGCDIKLLKKLVKPLFSKSSRVGFHAKNTLLRLLISVSELFRSQFPFIVFNRFIGKPVSIPFLKEASLLKCLTLQTWFKINALPAELLSGDDVTVTTLFLLANSSNSDSSVLRIELINYKQFMVSIQNRATGSRIQFTFNHIIDLASVQNQGFTHFCLTYDNYQNLNLFIDGEYSESIPCSSLSAIIESWNKIYIGHSLDDFEIGTNFFTRGELLIKDLTVFDTSLPYEWVSLFYWLGIGYDWTHKEFNDENILNLVNQLQPEALVLLGFRVNEITETKAQSRSSARLRHQSSLSHISSPATKRRNYETADRKAIASLLLKAKLKKTSILFEFDELNFFEETSRGLEIVFHRPESIYGALYSLGGAGLLLTLIEVIAKDRYDTKASRDTLFFNSVKLTLQFLRNSWRINKEFENLDGYWILALLVSFFKDNYNQALTFESERSLNESNSSLSSNNSASAQDHMSLLGIFLEFSGCSSCDGHDSIIYNPVAFRFLVANFDLYAGTSEFPFLKETIQSLLCSGQYNSYNIREFARIKLLQKIIQHTKSEILNDKFGQAKVENLCSIMEAIINSEMTTETIRGVSQFVIFALYGDLHSTIGEKIGLECLQALTNKLCDPSSSIKLLKKFSRSITIHWILLLLSYDGNNEAVTQRVICCGIALLAKLLKVLGFHIIKRFFQFNKGLDVLTYFLQKWWSSDVVMSYIFLAGFGVDNFPKNTEDLTISVLVKDKEIIQSSKKLAVPDFMLLINNLTLIGLNVLGQKQGKVLSVPSSPIRSNSRGKSVEDEVFEVLFNVLHLINQISDTIEIGYSDSPALQELFVSKEWLEGSFEIMAHLRLTLSNTSSQLKTSFQKCTDNFTAAISVIFISNLFHAKQLFGILKKVNDITKKLILDAVFPRIFQHVSEFVLSSKFIYREKEYMNAVIDLIKCYYSDFMLQNYYIKQEDLDRFLDCAIAILETEKDPAIKLQIGPIIGKSLLMKFSDLTYPSIGEDHTGETNDAEFADKLDERVKLILYKQAFFLDSDILSDSCLRQIIELILGNFCKLTPDAQLRVSEHVLNFIRTSLMMRTDAFKNIVLLLTAVSDYQNANELVKDFFENLTTRNDEETVRYLQRSSTLRHIFNKSFQLRMSKLSEKGSVKVMDMVSVMFNSGGRLGYMNNVYIKSFEKDCETLKVNNINGELLKYNRELQDKQESNIFFESSFNLIKLEIFRLLSEKATEPSDYTLDYIEGVDRMRKLLVVEDQLPESEKLTYTVAVPVKKLETIMANSAEYDKYHFAFATAGIDTLSLSENPLLGSEIEDYEEVDEAGDTEGPNAVHEDRNRKVVRSLYMGDQIQTIFNVSRINGLDAVESLMILGFSHLYLIENYFHCSDGLVVDADEAPDEQRDPYLQLIRSPATNGGAKTHRTRSWTLENLSSISKRKFLLRDIALEMFFKDGASILITCLSTKQRDSVYNQLSPYATGKGLDKDFTLTLELSVSTQLNHNSSGSGSFFPVKLAHAFSNGFSNSSAFQVATKKWKMGKMSNFYYLMTINTLAGRTFNDLTQYPVFPWVIADYESEELDLSDPKSFRDLSKPMGAQTEARARQFEERFEALHSLNDKSAPAFHYGTHYSSAMIVSSYLIRLKPYVQSYLLLQGGKFDHADRLFNSVGKAWLSASRDNTTDIRELIPEFFYLPEFLKNHNNFEFGNMQNGEASNDVELPKWAKGDPKIFIAKNREALESPYVSANLHKWIDLIFGFKQSGDEAVKALNVFHHLSYDGAIDLDNINDEVEKRAVIGMINNFGQTPLKVFNKPHPAKEVLNLPNFYLSYIDTSKTQPACTFESKLHLPIEKLEISSKTRKWIGRPACTSSEDLLLIRKPSPYKSKIGCGSLVINTTMFMNLHLTNISALVQIGNNQFVTGSEDGVIHVWKCSTSPTLRVSDHHVLRGHFSAIRSFVHSKTFKVCLSVDSEGGVILWDFTRFKFCRRITSPSEGEDHKVLVAISNDTGNFCILHSSKYANVLTIYTLNGEVILKSELKPGNISALCFPSINDSLVDLLKSDYHHAYWSSELVAVCYALPQRNLQIYEVAICSQGWKLQLLQSVDLAPFISASVTALQVLKNTEVDMEEKLSRGRFNVVLGDASGRVYVA